jgi:hypothetical protein
VKILQSKEGLRNLIITTHHKLIGTIYKFPRQVIFFFDCVTGDILLDMMSVEAIEFHISLIYYTTILYFTNPFNKLMMMASHLRGPSC